MQITFSPLFSGSSGNSTLVSCGNTNILIDAGVSGKKIIDELKNIGVDPGTLSAILVTHEHDDHIKGVGILSRKFSIPIYATEGTWNGMRGKIGNIDPNLECVIERERDFYFGDLDIMPFPTPHDANESCGYTFEHNGLRFSIATDVGCIKPQWFDHVAGSDAVLLESNYDPGMLQAGSYPYQLKHRILSNKGHLCNDDAAIAAKKLVESGTGHLILGHLSKENNYPELARACTEQYLMMNGILSGEDFRLDVANRDGSIGLFGIERD